MGKGGKPDWFSGCVGCYERLIDLKKPIKPDVSFPNRAYFYFDSDNSFLFIKIKCPKSFVLGDPAKGYIDTLENNGIVDFVQNGEVALFQQDGARCHTALTTRQWFASKTSRCWKGGLPIRQICRQSSKSGASQSGISSSFLA